MNESSSLLSAIYRRRLTVLLVMLSSIATGVYYSLQTPTEYLSVSKILVPTAPPSVSLKTEKTNIPMGPIVPNRDEELRIGLIGIVHSGAVHDRVAEALPGIDAERIRKNIVGDIGRDSFLNILAYGKTAEESVLLSNAFSEAFQDEMQAALETGPRRSLEAFKRREPLAWNEFSELSMELVAYLDSVGFSDIETEAGNLIDRRKVVTQQLEQLELQHKQHLAQRPVYEQLIAGRPEFVITGQSLSENSAYKSALERSHQLATELALKKLEFKDQHPEIVRLSNELAMVQARMEQQAEMTHSSSTMSADQQSANFMQKMVEIEIADAVYDSQRSVFEDNAILLDSLLENVPRYRSEVSRISAQIMQARLHAEDISARRAELEFHLDHGIRFTISNEYTKAVVAKAIAIPTPLGIMIFSILAGFVAGIVVAIISELVKQMRLRNPY